MSGTVPLTIGGAFNGITGTVTVPSSLLFGATGATSVNALIQTYLGTLTDGLANSTYDFENYDIAASSNFVAPATAPSGSSFEEITNVTPDSIGGTVAAAPGGYQATVTAGVTDLVVQLPGSITLKGSANTTNAVFGASSNVNYTLTDPDAGTLYLAGGANSVTLYTTSTTNAETIYSAGQDTINLVGQGTDYVTVTGNADVQDTDANAVVVAEGSATTNFYWNNSNDAGTLNFTNNSSVAATIYIHNGSDAKVTAYGGNGGGFFVGGAAGDNSLVGGAGVVTLIGAGSNDFLEAQSSIGTNILDQGAGEDDTVIATSSTGANNFGIGIGYPGIGNPASSGTISTSGSGQQTFFLGTSSGETIYGSTNGNASITGSQASIPGASNVYFKYDGNYNGASIGGGTYDIYNFINSNSQLYLVNNGDNQGVGVVPGATITSANTLTVTSGLDYQLNLSDGSTINFLGLTQAEINAIHTVNYDGIDTGIIG